MREILRRYYRLAKPGIVYGNALSAMAGYFFAAEAFSLGVFLAMLAGNSLVIAASCVCNNVLDRDMDAKMERTKRRAMPQGQISVPAAILFAAVLLSCGLALLSLYTTLSATVAAALIFITYVALYTPSKRFTMYSTHIGAIPGALPPVVGYCAAAGFSVLSLYLFIMMVYWQMAHFFAIAIFRRDEYAAAGAPVLTVRRGVKRAKIEILIYVILFAIACFAFPYVAKVSIYYWLLIVPACVLWLLGALRGFRFKDETGWARRMFRFSLIVLLVWSLAISLA